MASKKTHYIFGAVALAFTLLGLFVTFGSGAFADPDRKPATENSDQGLTYQKLGF
jgi:hypothetical protein